MNINEAMEFIHQTQYKGSMLGLSRMEKLMSLLGNPHKKLKYIHIAGTNGKGSTAAMLASILTEAGYKTGLYTSPYINTFNERIQINGKNIPDEYLIKEVERLQDVLGYMDEKPTEFEIVTAIGFMYFYECKCNIVVLEVGLGGRLDSTNVIDTLEAAVITTLGLEHIKELGDTIEKIAWEKAGIIKKSCDVVLYEQENEVHDVVKSVCLEKLAKLHIADLSKIELLKYSLKDQTFNYGKIKDIKLNLLGEHQLKNAALVLNTVEVLKNKGWKISQSDIYTGLAKVKWPGRFEVLSESPYFVVDGAHNSHGVDTLVNSINKYFSGRKITFLTGVMKDKDYEKMFDMVAPYAEKFIAVQPDSPRALNYQELGLFLRDKYHIKVIGVRDVQEGIKEALMTSNTDDINIAFGSLYMVGQIREFFIKE